MIRCYTFIMIEINGLLFEIRINKKKMRNMYMRIHDNIIDITAPKYVKDDEIYHFIREKKDWIYETYYKNIIHDNNSYKYNHGNIFYLFGEAYDLDISLGRSKYIINDNKIHLIYKDMDKEKALAYLYKQLNKTLLLKAKEYLDKYLYILKDYNYYEYPMINAKILKSKWGVCYTKQNKINISSYLIHYPLICLEYIMLHEMTHFIIPNHSKRFYSIILNNMPNYKEAEKILKR